MAEWNKTGIEEVKSWMEEPPQKPKQEEEEFVG